MFSAFFHANRKIGYPKIKQAGELGKQGIDVNRGMGGWDDLSLDHLFNCLQTPGTLS
jgi:hypothetical protein